MRRRLGPGITVILITSLLLACGEGAGSYGPEHEPGQGGEVSLTEIAPTVIAMMAETPGAPDTQPTEVAIVGAGEVTSFEQTLADKLPSDFEADTVFWYTEGNTKIEQNVGSESPFTAIAGLDLKNKADGSLIRRAIVSSSLTQFAVATELNQGEWVVETPVFPGKYMQIAGLGGKWEARGYFAGGNPVAGDAYQVDADGKYTGKIAYCNYTIGTCNVIDTESTGTNGGYITSLIPKFESDQRAILDVFEDLGVNTSEYNYAFNTETKELGVFLDKDAFLSMQGVLKLTLADGNVVKLPINEVKYDDENGFSYPGYEQNTDGNWVEAESPAQKQLDADLENFISVMETYTLGETDGKSVVLTDKESGEVKFSFTVGEDGSLTDPVTGEVVYKNGRWDLSYARTLIKESGNCKVTEWTGNHGEIAGPATPTHDLRGYSKLYSMPLHEYYAELVKQRILTSYGLSSGVSQYLGGGCWGEMPTNGKADQNESIMLWKSKVGRPKYLDIFMTSKNE